MTGPRVKQACPRSIAHQHEPRITNLLNPKIAVLYVSLLPQFIDPDRGSVAVQSLLLGATQISIALSVNALIVVCAGGLAAFLTARPTWLRAQRYLMGVVLGALAVRLATDQANRLRADSEHAGRPALRDRPGNRPEPPFPPADRPAGHTHG